MKTKVAVLFSGGKDSCLALHKAVQEGYEVSCLLTILPSNKDSFMFHAPIEELLKKQVKELGIEHVVMGSKGQKEKELGDLEELIRKVRTKVKGIVVGGIASNYQGKRIKKICEKLGLEFIAPLWDYEPEKIWKELLEAGFKIILTKVSCEGISRSFIGKVIGKEELEELKKLGEKFGFRLDFEGGEAESAVVYMPEFKKEIKIEFKVRSEGKYRHFLELEKIKSI